VAEDVCLIDAHDVAIQGAREIAEQVDQLGDIVLEHVDRQPDRLERAALAVFAEICAGVVAYDARRITVDRDSRRALIQIAWEVAGDFLAGRPAEAGQLKKGGG
jgi:hypothetical protein